MIVEGRVVARGDLAPAGKKSVELVKLRASQRALKIGDAIIVPERLHLVVPRPLIGVLQNLRVPLDPVRAERTEPIAQLAIVRRHRAALARRHMLHRVKGKHRHVRVTAIADAVRRAGAIRPRHT